jgi:hypothetical protein
MAERDDQVNERGTWLTLLERYGFGLALASAVLWFVRVDIVVPMVTAHAEFLKEMAAAQRDIAVVLRDQSDILREIKNERLAQLKGINPMP